MIRRIKPSEFIAVQNAKISVAADSPLDSRQAELLLNVIEGLLEALRARITYIGEVNEWFSHMVDEGHAGVLPEAEVDRLAALYAGGAILAVDDTGLSGNVW